MIQHHRQARSDRIAGVMLLDLVPGNVLQGELDLEEEDHRDRTKLRVALATLNQRDGKGTVHSGATGGDEQGQGLGNEAGEAHAAVHDAVGGCAGGESAS